MENSFRVAALPLCVDNGDLEIERDELERVTGKDGHCNINGFRNLKREATDEAETKDIVTDQSHSGHKSNQEVYRWR